MCGKTNVDKLDDINGALARARADADERRRQAAEIEAKAEALAREQMQELPRAYHLLVELGHSAGHWLVDDWRRAWTWLSVQTMAIASAALLAWAAFPDDLKAVLPPRIVQVAAGVLLVLGIAGRVVNQKGGQK